MARTLHADVFVRLHGRFRAETDALIAWLQSRPQDPAEISERCHRVAGTAAVFGYPALRAALQAVERAADAGPADDIWALAGAVARYWQVARSTMPA